MANAMGLVSTSSTLFAQFNIIILILLLIALPLLNWLLSRGIDKPVTVDPENLKEATVTEAIQEDLPARKLEHSRLLTLTLGLLGLIYIVTHFASSGFSLTLNSVNFLFLFLGLLLHGHANQFLAAVNNGVKGAGGIIIQFPLYAGIMGMMMHSGLGQAITEWFISIATPASFPLLTFLSAGLLNMFIPSGGGQWAVQAPIMIPAAIELGVSPPSHPAATTRTGTAPVTALRAISGAHIKNPPDQADFYTHCAGKAFTSPLSGKDAL